MQQSKDKEPYFYSNQKHISFLTVTLNVVKAIKVPEYRTKYSKHEYSQHQLLTLIIFKEYLGMRYRQFKDILELMGDIKPILGRKIVVPCRFKSRSRERIICVLCTSSPQLLK